jgi:hypothetical protein
VALGQVFSENFGFPCQSTFHLLSTIIFTITRGWHNRPGVAAVPNQKKKKNADVPTSSNHTEVSVHFCHGKHMVASLQTLLSDLAYLLLL